MSSIFNNTIQSIYPDLSHHQIEELTHETADLGSAASSHYARGLCFMPNLLSLNLYSVKLSDEFYSTMASEASRSKVYQTRYSLETICFQVFNFGVTVLLYPPPFFFLKKSFILISYEHCHINIINSLAMLTRNKYL